LSELNRFIRPTELAKGEPNDPTKLAHFEVLLALASIHTTLLREFNVLYNVMAEPYYVEILRRELADVSRNGWSKSSYVELQLLNSVLRKCHRISPPTSIGLKRIMGKPSTLADGTHLPE
jgi:ent-kaurene oxidase